MDILDPPRMHAVRIRTVKWVRNVLFCFFYFGVNSFFNVDLSFVYYISSVWLVFVIVYTHQQVLWFDVSVDNVHPVQVLDGSCQVKHHGTGVPLAVLCG